MRERVVSPAAALISLERAKLHCKVDGTARDDEIKDAIETARSWVQAYLGVAVGEQTLSFTYDVWSGMAAVPYDVEAVISVKSAGVDVAYTLVGRSFTIDAPAPIVIQAKVGFSTATLPGPVKSAMLLIIKDLIDNQQAQVEVKLYENKAVENLLWPSRERLPL